MARTNNLTNFLNDVATAIKTKLGDNTPIPASQFDTKIGEIETVGTYQSKTINVTANGSQTVTPDTGYDALSSVVINVQVPVKQLQSKTYEFTQNTHIVLSPETGYDGFSSIELTINVPTIDTSDATATANDIVENKTAYVNGQKITGTISERRNTQYLIPTGRDTTIRNSPRARCVIATSKVVDSGDSYVIDSTNKAQIEMPYADVASAISLTAEKIVSGNTILGIEGAGGSSYDTNLVLDSLDAGGAEQYLGGTPITDITNVCGFDVFNTNGDSILYYVMKTVTARSNMTGFSMNNIRVLDNGVIQWIPYGNNTVFNTDDFLECTITCTDAYNNTETKIITIYNSEKENYPGPDDPGPDDPGEWE